MSTKEELTDFVDQLLENAVAEYHTTPHYQLLKEKLDQMHQDCDGMLMEDEKEFAFECFELITQIESQQEAYLCHRAFGDCVAVLKGLGLLG